MQKNVSRKSFNRRSVNLCTDPRVAKGQSQEGGKKTSRLDFPQFSLPDQNPEQSAWQRTPRSHQTLVVCPEVCRAHQTEGKSLLKKKRDTCSSKLQGNIKH